MHHFLTVVGEVFHSFTRQVILCILFCMVLPLVASVLLYRAFDEHCPGTWTVYSDRHSLYS